MVWNSSGSSTPTKHTWNLKYVKIRTRPKDHRHLVTLPHLIVQSSSQFFFLQESGRALNNATDSISAQTSKSKGKTMISVNKCALVVLPYFAVAQLKGVYRVEQRKKTLIRYVDSSIHYPVYCCKGDVKESQSLYKQQDKLKK